MTDDGGDDSVLYARVACHKILYDRETDPGKLLQHLQPAVFKQGQLFVRISQIEDKIHAAIVNCYKVIGFFKFLCTFAVPMSIGLSGVVAQMVEQRTENPCVTGSIPVDATENQS